MIAGQKLKRGNIEVLLFPLSYMYISQGEGGSYSHAGSYNVDFLGWGANGRIYNCSYYAPCSMSCVYQSISGGYNIWNSDNPVYLADGSTSKICLMVVHDDNVTRYHVGSHVNQGDLLGQTGSSGQATGDHVHMNIARGEYAGQMQTPEGTWTLRNSLHLYSCMYVNKTVLIEDYNYTWLTYSEIYTEKKKNNFKWVLYSNKLRKKRM